MPVIPTLFEHSVMDSDQVTTEILQEHRSQPVVRRLTRWVHTDPADSTLPLRKVSTTVYDGAGREIEHTDYAEDGQIDTRSTMAYDGSGNLVAKTVHEAEFNREHRYRYTYRFDDQGRVTEKVEHREGSPRTTRCVYSYGEQGDWEERTFTGDEVASVKEYSPDGTLTRRYSSSTGTLYQYEYDEQGHITRAKESRSGRPARYISYKNAYDRAGNLICVETGNRARWYRYDESNHVIEEQLYDESGELDQIYTYGYEYA